MPTILKALMKLGPNSRGKILTFSQKLFCVCLIGDLPKYKATAKIAPNMLKAEAKIGT